MDTATLRVLPDQVRDDYEDQRPNHHREPAIAQRQRAANAAITQEETAEIARRAAKSGLEPKWLRNLEPKWLDMEPYINFNQTPIVTDKHLKHAASFRVYKSVQHVTIKTTRTYKIKLLIIRQDASQVFVNDGTQ